MQQYVNPGNDTATCQLTLVDSKGQHFFSSGNIIRLEAADNYTIVHFNGGRRPFIVSKVLKVYDELLKPFGFVRVHRRHLVNKHFVKCIEERNIVMQDDSLACIARRKQTFCIRQLRENTFTNDIETYNLDCNISYGKTA